MNLFDPRTFSTDWEINVIDKLTRSVGSDKLLGFAGMLRSELDLPIQTDWNALECALGINRSLDQIWERVQRVTDRASQVLREFDLDLFPSGAHPMDAMFNSAHIHVGTIHDEAAAIRLQNSVMKYVPVFGALAANSAVWNSQRGEYKSYRMRKSAWGAVRPIELRDPETSQLSPWWCDTAPKLIWGSPTLEVRIPDCASSRRMLAELATFVAAYLHHMGTKPIEAKPSAEQYREFLTNRFAASRHGLQATFTWNGEPRPVVELLDEMLDECGVELDMLGAKRSDLRVLSAMVEKRMCQADFALSVAERYPEKYAFTSAYSKLVRHWTVFEEYLESASPLEPVAVLNEDTILAQHLSAVGEGTSVSGVREAMYYPGPVTSEIVELMLERQLIQKEVTPNRGTLLYRIS